MKIYRTAVLSAFLMAGAQSPSAAPASLGAISGAQDSTGQSQLQRLRESHLKELALGREAMQFYGEFEALALEMLQAPGRDNKDLWESAQKVFGLTPNHAGDARQAVQWYVETFELSREISGLEDGLAGLGDPDPANKEKSRAIKDLEKKAAKNRKKIERLRGKIKNAIKSVLLDDKGDQEQGLKNWLMVSSGLLRDEREAREAVERARALPRVLLQAGEDEGEQEEDGEE